MDLWKALHPTQSDLFFTVLYIILSVCLVNPPAEFTSAGLTVQNMLSFYLGSEHINFVSYHVKRTAITLVFHATLPLGYFLGHAIFLQKYNLFAFWSSSPVWAFYLLIAVCLPLVAGGIVFYWSRNEWKNHSLIRTLKLCCTQDENLKQIISLVNAEFRQVDKFTSGSEGRRVIVTDNWVIQLSAYYVYIGRQRDMHTNLAGSDEYSLSHEGTPTGVQYLTIAIHNIHSDIKTFYIRVNATEFGDLKAKLQAPVRNIQTILIKQSLSDRFLEAFEYEVRENPPLLFPDKKDLEPCIGCMQKPANVKLQKLCMPSNDGECQQCHCRPMWCMECMARWFASRQDQAQPNSWLSSRSPCPTCRSVFCVRDISIIV